MGGRSRAGVKFFFKDLKKKTDKLDKSNLYFVFSGDLVLAGSNKNLYTKFLASFDKELNNLEISKNHRICVPGNHDVSQDFVKQNDFEHKAVISQSANEKSFNDYMSKSPVLVTGKFQNYLEFQKEFCEIGLDETYYSGKGYEINSRIGIYCLNTALYSSGGYENIDDKGKLVIDTRNFQRWIQQSQNHDKDFNNAPSFNLVMRMVANRVRENY